MQKQTIMNLSNLIDQNTDQKIVSLPLQFQYLPVDILSKQFTKLNSPHQYRIHYLGPRFPNSHLLHKKYSNSGGISQKYYSSIDSILQCSRYQISMKKIIQSHFITEKLKNNHYYKSAIYYRAFQGMNPSLDLNKQYLFNSAFESGNLDCVIKIKPNQFDLFLRIDSNTRGHLQWFYFSIRNNTQLSKIILHICNISKSGTLYQNGMKAFVFSKQKYQKQGKQWQQNQSQCIFTQKPLRYNIVYQRINPQSLNQLTIQYQFKYQYDQVFFAYCVPYTYSKLIKYIKQLPQQFVRQYTLGRSLTGVDIPILHISNHEIEINKKNVLITGRIHPGQSNSSYVLSGFINYLCSDCKQAKELRNRMNFLIVPMINPDGVIMGNSRSSAAGKDLNRQYKTSNQQLFPQICLIKNLAYKVKKKFGLMFYLDFHGHSRKKNTFFYGPTYTVSDSQYYKCRILPKLIEKITNTFRFYSCSFNISQQKKSTARGVLFQQFKIPYTYTVQSSIGFYYDSQEKTTFSYNIDSWQQIGSNICKGFSQFIVNMEQFQQLMIERRIERKKAKERRELQRKLNNKKFIEDEQPKTYKQSLFFDMIQQIKSTPMQKNLQPQVSSDDHNDKQDLQLSKFMEFNTLVSGKKGKYQQKLPLQPFEIFDHNKNNEEKDQLTLMKQICQQKNHKIEKERTKVEKVNVFQRLVENPMRRNIMPKIKKETKKQTLIERRTSYQDKRNYYANIEKQLIGKISVANFTQAVKQKRMERKNILGRQFFPEPTCQVLQLPKSTHSSLFKRENKLSQPLKIINPQYSNKSMKKNQQAVIAPIRRYSHSNGDPEIGLINVQIDNQPISKIQVAEKQKLIWRSKIQGKKKYPFYQSCLISIQRNLSDIKAKNQTNGYLNADTLQIDNMAMTIKTFNK